MVEMKETIEKLAETQSSDVEGSSFTAHGLQPANFLQEIEDAAQKQLYFAPFVRVETAQKGQKDVVIPKRNKYKGDSGTTWNSGEQTDDIDFTTMDNLDSVTATPTTEIEGYAVTKYALQTNVVNLLDEAKQELSYAIGDKVDKAIAETIGEATASSSSSTGAQVLYGGDATSGNSLDSGDTLTVDMIAEAAKLLKSSNKQYRADGQGSSGGGYGSVSGTVSGNPWQNTNNSPFVLFIAPDQEMKLRQSSQFVNAAEYGGDEVVQNGEIGKYLGIRIVVTDNVQQVSSGDSTLDAEDANAGTDMTRCILCKPDKAAALVWGRRREVNMWDYNERDQVRISLVSEYDVKVIHDDAIVFIDVANE